MTNVFSLAKMTKNYQVEFNFGEEDAFLVHTPRKLVKFMKRKENLYVFKPNGKVNLAMNTVEENKRFHTPSQVVQAKLARKFMASLAYPSIQDLQSVIKVNLLKDNKVMEDDIKLAEQIFGSSWLGLNFGCVWLRS